MNPPRPFRVMGYALSEELYKNFRIAIYITIIFAAHMSGAVIHEKIYKTPYQSNRPGSEPGGDYFSDPYAVPLFNYFFGFVYGFFKYEIARSNHGYAEEHEINPKKVLQLSLVDISISLLFNWLIVLTSFTAMNLVHCCSFLFVVLFAVFFSKLSSNDSNKVERSQIIISFIVCFGIVLYNMAGSKLEEGVNKSLTVGSGAMVLGMLCVQGYRYDLAAQIRAEFNPPPSLLYYQVARYCFLLFVVISALSTHLWKTAVFIWYHDSLSLDLMMHAVLDVIGCIFIYRILVLHKQHVVPFVLTIRKLLTSILNILYFHHSINKLQFVGLGLVGVGILLALVLQYRKTATKDHLSKVEQGEEVEDTI